MSVALQFFCTRQDVLECLEAAEGSESLKYYAMSSGDDAAEPWRSAAEVSSQFPETIEAHWVVARDGATLLARKIESDDGRVWYAVDQLQNPDTVLIHLGIRKGEILSPGSLSTVSRTAESVSLFKNLERHFKKRCKKVKSYWVGPEALVLLRSGWRLASSETSSRTYDLQE